MKKMWYFGRALDKGINFLYGLSKELRGKMKFNFKKKKTKDLKIIAKIFCPK